MLFFFFNHLLRRMGRAKTGREAGGAAWRTLPATCRILRARTQRVHKSFVWTSGQKTKDKTQSTNRVGTTIQEGEKKHARNLKTTKK